MLAREIYERSSTTVEVTLGSSALQLKDRILELQKRK